MHRRAPRHRFHSILAALLVLLPGAAWGSSVPPFPASPSSAPAPPAPASSASPAPASSASPSRGPRYVDGEVLIVFRPDARPGEVQQILRDLGATRIHTSRRSRVERHKIRMRVEDAVAKYRNHPAVRLIEPNYLIHADRVPNDPSFPIQWSLQNTGQQGGTAGDDIHATVAWDRTTGSNQVIVAIVDTGMDLTHPDLAPNLYTNPGEIPGNQLDDDGNGLTDDVHGFDFANFDGDPTDDNGHGTHVAGTIGALGDDGVGVAGVVWHVRLLPLKFLDAGGTGITSDAIDCVDYAVAAGASVINASWGSSERSQALELAIQNAGDAGVLFVAAAGNTGSSNDVFGNYPASFPEANVIAVGATGRSDERAAFSNYGERGVDLFAPGVQILSTLPGGRYALESGTSMAAPHVSGALALLKSRFPAMLAGTMKEVLLAATDRVPALAALCVSGGRLNAARMLEGVDSIPPAPVTDLVAGAVSSDRISVTWTATGDDGATGTATQTELRYATTPFDASSFSSATRLPGLAAPRAAGSREEASIPGLSPLTDYYVALIVRDEFGNASPLSNVLRARTTAPPVAVILPDSAGATLLTGQRATPAVQVSNTGEGILDLTAQLVALAGAPAPKWATVAPTAASIPAGGQSSLTVTLSADGLAGGDYAALLRLTTNDPLRHTLDVPVALHVISAPDLDTDPTSMIFGPVPVGNSDVEDLFVTNSGFADLHVSSVMVEGVDFTTDPGGFVLPPGQSWDLLVTAAPTRTGPLSGSIVITSDDPDQSITRVPLEASGIVPPVVSVAPGRQSASLHTGQSTTRTFTFSNNGGSILHWSLRPRSAAMLNFDSTGALHPAPAASAAPGDSSLHAMAAGATTSTDISNVRIVFDARHGASSGAWSDFIGSLSGRGAIFTLNRTRISAAVLAGADVYWVSDDAGAFGPDERAALAAWVRSGGSLVLEGAATAELSEFDAILDSTGVPLHYEADQGITGPTRRIYPFEITRGVTAADMPSSTGRLHLEGPGAMIVVQDAQGFSTLGAAFVERGRVLAVAGRLFADVSSIFADNRKLATQSFDWLAGAAWLSVSSGSGSIGPGQSSTISIGIDGDRLAGATYRGALVARTNDPDHADFLLPVDLAVEPAPDAHAFPASVDWGTVFVGAERSDSIHVANDGVLPLRVLSVTVDHSDFRAPFDSLTLTPGASVTVPIRYAPTTVGAARATLAVRTDDPDEPEIDLTLHALAAPAPDIDVVAAPVAASLATGGTAARSLTVANRVGSDLEYAIHFEENAPAASATASTTRAEALPRTWAEAGASARALTRSIAAAAAVTPPDSLPLVIFDPDGDGSVVDLTTVHAWARGGVLSVRLEIASDLNPNNLGGYLSLDLDQNRNTGRAPSFGSPRQDIGAEFEVSFFSVGFGVVDLLDASTGNYVESFPVQVDAHSISFAIPLTWLDDDDGRMNVTGVIGNFVGATDWFPDRGHGSVGGVWLTAAPARGTLAAGTEAPVALTLDALDLPGGSYAGSIVIESNDPDEPVVAIPATLQVTDAPVAAVTPANLHLGTVFLGDSSAADVVVANQGRAPLVVASAASTNPDFSVAPGAFTVAPGGTQAVHVIFTPTGDGSREGTLNIVHDAAGPAIAIGLSGFGRVPPVAGIAPAAVEGFAALGAKGSATLTIQNTGGSGLDFGIEAMNGAAAVAPQAGLALARDEDDPRPGIGPGALGIGGPDGFGYRWADSNQPGGPVFDWQDISTIGTPVPIRNLDQNSGPLPIGFTFSFYGREYTTFNVCTHGWISFTDTTVQFANQPLPTTVAPANLLAIFWDDLNFGGVEHAFYYNDGTRLIVQFEKAPRRQRGGPFTFQAILYPTGAIVYQYLQMGPPVDSGTIGIQNRTKTDGLTVVFNSSYLTDRMAIRFSAAPAWVSVTRPYGTIDAGDSAQVGIAFDARGLFAGEYHGILRVQTNDPNRVETMVPVLLHATGIPRLAFSPASLAFDTLEVGTTEADTLRVTNNGTDRLDAAAAFDRADFTAEPANLSLTPLQSGIMLVRFAPTAAGDRSGTLTLTSNDPDHPATAIPVSGVGRLSVRPLAADVSPAVIRLGSRGQEIRARVLMPADLDARRVSLAAIRFQGTVPPLSSSRIRDLDGDGRPDLDLAFERAAAQRTLVIGNAVSVAITGAVSGGPRFEARDTIRVLGGSAVAGVEFEADEMPAATEMRASAPNPFQSSTAIRFDLSEGGAATLRVYAASGRLVRTIFRAALPGGRFRAAWDGRDDRGQALPSGVYFARLEVSGPAPYRGVGRIVRVR